MLEPKILTQNTYFWNPSSTANGRRNNEKRHIEEVSAFFKKIGLKTDSGLNRVIGTKGELEVVFYYNESCKNVYKSLSITRNGRKSNITQLRKLYQ